MVMVPADLEVTHAFATVNGLRMHYVEKGTGPLVVLLHGFPENWWSWRYQLRALAEAGFRAVAPDLRGYNETETTGPYDIDTLRNDVAALIEHLTGGGGGKALIVAHDWGGAVAWHLTSTRPDLCSKLVVMNCPHPVVFQKALTSKLSQLRRSWYMFFFQLPMLPERLLTAGGGGGVTRALRGLAIDKTNFGREELAPLVEGACKPGRVRAMLGWYRAAIRTALRSGRAGLEKAGPYPRITLPTLLLWAMEDTALGYDDVVPGTERYVPGIEIQTIPACGHFVQQERPIEVNRRLIEFLKRRPASAAN